MFRIRMLSIVFLFAFFVATGMPLSASATCTSQDYMEKIQSLQLRLMELQSEDPDKVEDAMERLREVAQSMTTTVTGGMTPESVDLMCKKLDEMRDALE
jgi:hypothetical protein